MRVKIIHNAVSPNTWVIHGQTELSRNKGNRTKFVGPIHDLIAPTEIIRNDQNSDGTIQSLLIYLKLNETIETISHYTGVSLVSMKYRKQQQNWNILYGYSA